MFGPSYPLVFNRKRSGEAERMKISEYKMSQKDTNVDPAIKNSLSTFEKRLCDTHHRIEIMGKRNRKVAILLTDKMKNWPNI